MTSDNTLKTALALIAKPDGTAASAFLEQTRDELDISGAEAAIEELEDRRRGLLLTASDKDIESIDNGIRAATRDLDRRRAAAEALKPLIEVAEERERQNAIRILGFQARDARNDVLAAYVRLDEAALKIVDLVNTVRTLEAEITAANARFREEKRNDLLVPLPMDELAMLAGCDGQFLPRIAWWSLNGYTDHSQERPGDPEAQPYAISRRFGRLAELLPRIELVAEGEKPLWRKAAA